MKALRLIATSLGLIVLFAVAGFFAPRCVHDGPIGPIPGGPLQAGDLYEFPVSDWTFASDVREIEMQLESQRISRTTWILVRSGAAYVPCSLGFPPGKSWYRSAQEDGRATLRIGDKRYPVQLTKDDDPTLVDFARAEVTRKYGNAPPSEGGVMFFRVTSRPAALE